MAAGGRGCWRGRIALLVGSAAMAVDARGERAPRRRRRYMWSAWPRSVQWPAGVWAAKKHR